jgi:hypothetical protein
MVGVVTAYYDPGVVLMAAIATFVVTAAVTAYAFTTKRDFTWVGSLIWVFGALVFMFFFFFFLDFWNNPVIYIMYNSFGVLIYSVYLIYDT